ncbi:MAG: rod shape-determining protein MreC [Oscillospiraceae bacterium]|nr:rod shape-determining protein MreC [Oscillospiraceae bacterium]
MKEFIHSRRFKVIVCIFALLLGFMIYAAAAGGAASLPERVFKTVTSPFVRFSTGISNFVVDNVDKVVNADRYKRENDEYRKIISELNQQIVNIDELKNENRLLQELLEMSNENPDFSFPDGICTIIARNGNDPFAGFTIDRGGNHGISLNDLVLTHVGVVGIISQVAPGYSQVTTLLSPEVGIGVITTRSNIEGVLQNDIVFTRDGLVRVSFIHSNADIEVGDMFVTIGKSGVYPPGQIVGKVVEVYDDSNGMSKHALIEPAEDVTRLNSVIVITDFEGREENEDK